MNNKPPPNKRPDVLPRKASEEQEEEQIEHSAEDYYNLGNVKIGIFKKRIIENRFYMGFLKRRN